MSGNGAVRGIKELFSRLGPPFGAGAALEIGPAAIPPEPGYPTKAFTKFLASLAGRRSPVLLDLGPVVGSNVTFFGERLGCKIFVEDLFADLDRHARQGALAAFPAFLKRRFPQAEGSVDGILCWDLLDYVDPISAQSIAVELMRVLRVEGTLLAFFGTASARDASYTKYVIVDDLTLRHRSYEAARGRQRVLQNRDIIRLFGGLRVSDSFLLQTNTREILFRKPAYLSGLESAGLPARR